MKLNMYSIFDTASGLYSKPFLTGSDAEALRSFRDITSDAEHPLGQHPEDYSLTRVGIFDDISGTLHNEVNETLSTGLEAVAFTRKATGNQLEFPDLHATDADYKPGLTD